LLLFYHNILQWVAQNIFGEIGLQAEKG